MAMCNSEREAEYGGRSSFAAVLGFFLVSILFASCEKDPIVVSVNDPNRTCIPIPPFPGVGFGYNSINETRSATRPFFNPNNDNEFLFVSMDRSIGIPIIYRYDLVTQTKEHIYTGELYSVPIWGSNDWILLNFPDKNIWKIKSNGDSLTQLTFTVDSFYPKWNMAADRIIYDRAFAFNRSILMSADGTPIDTLENNSIGDSWNHPNYMVNTTYNSISYFDPISDAPATIIYTSDEDVKKSGILWVGDDIYYSQDKGIFKIHISGAGHQVVRESCNAIWYLSPTVNASKTKLLWQRVEQELIDEKTIKVRVRLVMMNLDGSGEEEIEVY